MKIFVDTSVLVALNNIEDPTYSRAFQISKKIFSKNLELVTSNHIISETLTILSQKVAHQTAIDFKELWVPKMEVVHIGEILEETAFEIFKKLTSKNVSFVNCTSFALMKEFGILTVFTFDKDFKKQGFKILE